MKGGFSTASTPHYYSWPYQLAADDGEVVFDKQTAHFTLYPGRSFLVGYYLIILALKSMAK